MLEIPVIDSAFIREWAPKYDASEHDEDEYEQLVLLVPKEISETGTISSETFKRIYKWKAPRAIKTVEWRKFNAIYAPRFHLAFSAPKYRKLPILVLDEDKIPITGMGHKLPGINVPVASTLLHFGYRGEFPIMDIRTAEVLYCFCQLRSEKRGWKEYDHFKSVMLSVAQQSGDLLRRADKALFAFHKCEFEPKLGLKPRMSQRERHEILKGVKERRSLSI